MDKDPEAGGAARYVFRIGFRLDPVDRAPSKYLGRSIRVVPEGERVAWFGSE